MKTLYERSWLIASLNLKRSTPSTFPAGIQTINSSFINNATKIHPGKIRSNLEEQNIHIQEAYLSGFCARGINSPYGDIDVALIADVFSGVRYLAMQKMGRDVLSLWILRLKPGAKIDVDTLQHLNLMNICQGLQ